MSTPAPAPAPGNIRIGAFLLAICVITTPTLGDDLTADLPENVTRPWIGPDFFANRLQDWRLADGRIECIEDDARFPLRTLQVLTRSITLDTDTGYMISFRAGMIEPADPDAAWIGLLFGAGGGDIDHRITALVHHRPAEDGGVLALVDGRGRTMFRDNSQGGGGGLWSIAGPIDPDDVPLLESIERGGDGLPPEAIAGELWVDVTCHRFEDRVELGIGVGTSRFRSDVSYVTTGPIDPALLEGGIALVAHRTCAWFDDVEIDVVEMDGEDGEDRRHHPDRTFGPIVGAMHTLGNGTLKLTTQMVPLGSNDNHTATLEVLDPRTEQWQEAARGTFVRNACTIPFRVENWDATRDTPYRVVYDERIARGRTRRHEWTGVIRAEPRDKDELVIAALTCNKVYTGGLKWNERGIWFPHADLVEHVAFHEPDFLYFSGDQIYEGDLTPAHANPPEKAMLDYLYKWYRWHWAFRDLTRDIPCVTIPDDHDVYHGNLWGAGGKRAEAVNGLTAQDSGGYKMPAWFVNAVHSTQTSHLPDPPDPTPVQQNISVYSTTIDYAGVSFAVISDRQWKSAPAPLLPEAQVVNGWYQNSLFHPATDADHPDAILLGQRQLKLLDDWAADWSGGTWMKVLLSQSIFANVATIPKDATNGSVIPSLPIPEPGGYLEDQRLAADMDSNGWPQSGRNRAVAAMRKAFAIHLAGDQHLGALIEYGVDEARDGGIAFSTPSIANTWPRRWYPPYRGRGGHPTWPRYTGDYLDGFGNHVSVYAVSNPEQVGIEPTRLNHAAPGYGIVRLNRATRDITFECWPRWVDPAFSTEATPLHLRQHQYQGWPKTFNQLDNYGTDDSGWWLPRLVFEGVTDPIVQVIDEATGEVVHTIRVRGGEYQPRVLRAGQYTVVIDPDDDRPTHTLARQSANESKNGDPVFIRFDRP